MNAIENISVLLRRVCTLDEFDKLPYSDLYVKVGEFICNHAAADSVVVCKIDSVLSHLAVQVHLENDIDSMRQYYADETELQQLFGERRYELAAKYNKPLVLAIRL